MSAKDERRLKRIDFAPELLMYMTSGKFEVVANPLPADAEIAWSYYDAVRNLFTIVVASKEFNPVIEAGLIPYADPPFIRRAADA